MDMEPKPVGEIEIADLMDHPVWEADVPTGQITDNTWVRPADEFPADLPCNGIIGTHVRFMNGGEEWGVLCNLTPSSPRKTAQFLAVWISIDGQWFHLARYFDADYDQRGPQQLADAMGLGVEEVFPISYDVSDVVLGDPDVMAGTILAEPAEQLSQEERTRLSLV